MTRCRLACLIAITSSIFIGLSENVSAQISVYVANLPKGEVQSGSNHTLVLNIQNESDDTLHLNFRHIIPKPLRALVFTDKISLLPRENQNMLIPISVPKI